MSAPQVDLSKTGIADLIHRLTTEPTTPEMAAEAAQAIEKLAGRQRSFIHHGKFRFSVYAPEENSEELTHERVLSGLKATISDLEGDGSDILESCEFYDNEMCDGPREND